MTERKGQNERYASELASECGRLLERLELALYDNPGTFQDLLRLMRRVTEHLLYGRERLKREVGEVMGGKVLELPTDKLREERETGRTEGREEGRAEGRTEGREEGRAEGRAEGDVFRLISQVRKKMHRRKPFDEICKELEEEARNIRPICEAFLRKGLDCPEEELYKEL